MRRILALLLLAGLLSGCLNWQAGYDNAARSECQADPDDRARRACLDRVETNARERREAGRHGK